MRFFVRWITILIVSLSAAPSGAQSPHFRVLQLNGSRVQWLMPVRTAHALTLTYSVVARPEIATGAINCGRMTSPTAMLRENGVDTFAWRTELRAAFDLWQAVTAIKFVELSPGSEANIKIGAQIDPIGRAFTNVAFDAAAASEPKPITQSLICLNPAVRWKVGFDGDLTVYDIRYTIAHEIGHAIGLDHPMPSGVVMGYRYDERFRELQQGDVAGAQALYGAAQRQLGQAEGPINTSMNGRLPLSESLRKSRFDPTGAEDSGTQSVSRGMINSTFLSPGSTTRISPPVRTYR